MKQISTRVMKMKNILKNTLAGALATLIAGSALAADINLLNVSCDPTRELYREYNAAFSKYWHPSPGAAAWTLRRAGRQGAGRAAHRQQRERGAGGTEQAPLPRTGTGAGRRCLDPPGEQPGVSRGR